MSRRSADETTCRCGQDLVPLDEVGRRLGVSARTVLRWHKRAGLPLLRLDGARGPAFASWRAVERWADMRE